jgi:hypothetical protein
MDHVSKNFAVLMGDLVQSERNASTEQLHVRFNAAIERQNSLHGEALASPLTITLGDEFQGLVTSLLKAAEIAREIRYDLMSDGIDCRFAIGVATLKTPLNTQRAWNMMGPGLASTRIRLNEKRSDTFYRFDIPEHPELETLLEASGASLTAIERSWTDTQRRDIQALLQGASPNELAKRRNVSVHTIYKVRNSGNFDLYLLHWKAVQQALAGLDHSFAIKRAT